MKSDVFQGVRAADIPRVLQAVEEFGGFCKLAHVDCLKLRLLAEEMFSMTERLLENYDSEFWVENNGKAIQLHLKEWAAIDKDQMQKLISASSDQKNAKTKSLFGKIVNVLEQVVSGSSDVMVNTYGYDFYNVGMVPSDHFTTAWSMKAYEDAANAEMRQHDWDGLEKSILAHIADDIVIGVRGDVAELVVKVTF